MSPQEFQILKKKIREKGYKPINIYFSGEDLMGLKTPQSKTIISGFYMNNPNTLLGVFKIPNPLIESRINKRTVMYMYEIRPVLKNYFEGSYKSFEALFANTNKSLIHEKLVDILLNDVSIPIENLFKKTSAKIINISKDYTKTSDFLPIFQEFSYIDNLLHGEFSNFKVSEDYIYDDFLDYHYNLKEFDRAYNIELVNFIEKKKNKLKIDLYKSNSLGVITDSDYELIDNFIVNERLKYYDGK